MTSHYTHSLFFLYFTFFRFFYKFFDFTLFFSLFHFFIFKQNSLSRFGFRCFDHWKDLKFTHRIVGFYTNFSIFAIIVVDTYVGKMSHFILPDVCGTRMSQYLLFQYTSFQLTDTFILTSYWHWYRWYILCTWNEFKHNILCFNWLKVVALRPS